MRHFHQQRRQIGRLALVLAAVSCLCCPFGAEGSSFARWTRRTGVVEGSNATIPAISVSSYLGEMVAVMPVNDSFLNLARMSSDTGNRTDSEPFYRDLLAPESEPMWSWSPTVAEVEMSILVSSFGGEAFSTFCEAPPTGTQGGYCGALVFSAASPPASRERVWLPKEVTFPAHLGSSQTFTSSQLPLFAPDASGEVARPWQCDSFVSITTDIHSTTDCLLLSMEEASASDSGCSLPLADPSLSSGTTGDETSSSSSLVLLRQGQSKVFVFRPLDVALETLQSLQQNRRASYAGLITEVPLVDAVVGAPTGLSFVGINMPPPGLMAPLSLATSPTSRICAVVMGFLDGSVTLLDATRHGAYAISTSGGINITVPLPLVQRLPFQSQSLPAQPGDTSASPPQLCAPSASLAMLDFPFTLHSNNSDDVPGSGFVTSAGSLLGITCGHQGNFWVVNPQLGFLLSTTPLPWSSSNLLFQPAGQYTIPSVPSETYNATVPREVMLSVTRVAFISLFNLSTDMMHGGGTSTSTDSTFMYKKVASSGTYVVTVATSAIGSARSYSSGVVDDTIAESYACVYGGFSSFVPGLILVRGNSSAAWEGVSPLLPSGFKLSATPVINTTFTLEEALGTPTTAIVPPLFITVRDRITGVLDVQYQHVLPVAAVATMPSSVAASIRGGDSGLLSLAFVENVATGAARWLLEHGTALSVTSLQHNLLVNLTATGSGDPQGAPGNRLAFPSDHIRADPYVVELSRTVPPIVGGSSFSRSPITLDPYTSLFTYSMRGDNGNGIPTNSSCAPSEANACPGVLEVWLPVLADSARTQVQSQSQGVKMSNVVLRSRGLSTGPSISKASFSNDTFIPPTCVFSLHRTIPTRLTDVANAIMCGQAVGYPSNRPNNLLPTNNDCSIRARQVIADTPMANSLFGTTRFFVPLRVIFTNSSSPATANQSVILSFTEYAPYAKQVYNPTPLPAGGVSPVTPWVEVVGQYDANFCSNSFMPSATRSFATSQVVVGGKGGWIIVVDIISDVEVSGRSSQGQIEMAYQSATATTTQQTFRSPFHRYNHSYFYVQRSYQETRDDLMLGLEASSLLLGSERVFFCLGDMMHSYFRVPGNNTWDANLTEALGAPVTCGVPDAMITSLGGNVLHMKLYYGVSGNTSGAEHAIVSMSATTGQILGVATPSYISSKFNGECGAAANAPPPRLEIGQMLDATALGLENGYISGFVAPIVGSRCLCAMFIKSGLTAAVATVSSTPWYSASVLEAPSSPSLQVLVLFSLTFNNFTTFIDMQSDSILLKSAPTEEAVAIFTLLSTSLDVLSSALPTVSALTGHSKVRSDYPYGFVPLLVNETVLATILLEGIQFVLVGQSANDDNTSIQGCQREAYAADGCFLNLTSLAINALDAASDILLWTDGLLDNPYVIVPASTDTVALFQFQADKVCVAYGRVRCYSILPRKTLLLQYNGTGQSWGSPATDTSGMMIFVSNTHPIHALWLDPAAQVSKVELLWENLTWIGSDTGVFISIDSTKCNNPFLSGESLFVSCLPSSVDSLPGGMAHLVIVGSLTGEVVAIGPWAGSLAQISPDAQRLTYANNLLTIISATFLTTELVVPFKVHAVLCGAGAATSYTLYLKEKTDVHAILLTLPFDPSQPYVLANSTINITVRRQSFIGGHIIGSTFAVNNTEELLQSLGLQLYSGSSIIISSSGPILTVVLSATSANPAISLSSDVCSPCTPQSASSNSTSSKVKGTCSVRCTVDKRTGLQYQYTQMSMMLVRQVKPFGSNYFSPFPVLEDGAAEAGTVGFTSKSLERTDCSPIFGSAPSSSTSICNFNISSGNLSQTLNRFIFDLQTSQQEIYCLQGGALPTDAVADAASRLTSPVYGGSVLTASDIASTSIVPTGTYCSQVVNSSFMSRWNIIHVFDAVNASGYAISTLTRAKGACQKQEGCLMLQSAIASNSPLFDVAFQLSATYELQEAASLHALSLYPNDDTVPTINGSVLLPGGVVGPKAQIAVVTSAGQHVSLEYDTDGLSSDICSTMGSQVPTCTAMSHDVNIETTFLTVTWVGSSNSLLGNGFVRTGTAVPVVWFLRRALSQDNSLGYSTQQLFPSTREQLAAGETGVACYLVTSDNVEQHTVCPATCAVNFSSCGSQVDGFTQSYIYSLTTLDLMPKVKLQDAFWSQCPSYANNSLLKTMSYGSSAVSTPSQLRDSSSTFVYAKMECTSSRDIVITAVDPYTGETLQMYSIQNGKPDALTGGTFSCVRCVYFLLTDVKGQPLAVMFLGSVKALLLCFVSFSLAQVLEKKKRNKMVAKRQLDHMEELRAALLQDLGRGEEVTEPRLRKATLDEDFRGLSEDDKRAELKYVEARLDRFKDSNDQRGFWYSLSRIVPNPIDAVVTVLLELLSIDEGETRRKARRLLTHSLIAPILSETELAVHLASIVSSRHLDVEDFANGKHDIYRRYASFYAQYLSGGHALIRGDIEEELGEVSEKVSITMREEFFESTGAVYLSFLAFRAMYSRFPLATPEELSAMEVTHPVLFRVMRTIVKKRSDQPTRSLLGSTAATNAASRSRFSTNSNDVAHPENYMLLVEGEENKKTQKEEGWDSVDVSDDGSVEVGAGEGLERTTTTAASRTRRQRKRKERETKQLHLKVAAQRLLNQVPLASPYREFTPREEEAEACTGGGGATPSHSYSRIQSFMLQQQGRSRNGSQAVPLDYSQNALTMVAPPKAKIPSHGRFDSASISAAASPRAAASGHVRIIAPLTVSTSTHPDLDRSDPPITTTATLGRSESMDLQGTGAHPAIQLSSTISNMPLYDLADELKKTRAVIADRRENFKSHFLKSTMYTHAIDEYLRPNKLILWIGLLQLIVIQALYAFDIYPRAYKAGLDSLNTYQVIYFLACNSSTFAGLFGDALARADWALHEAAQEEDGVIFVADSDAALSTKNPWTPQRFLKRFFAVFTDKYVLLTMFLFGPPLVTHVLPGMVLYLWVFLPGFITLSLLQMAVRTFVSQILTDNTTNSRLITYIRRSWPLRRRHRLAFILRSFLRLMIVLFINLVVSLSFSYAAIGIYNRDSTSWDSNNPYQNLQISKISASYHHTDYLNVVEEDYSSRQMMCFIDGILQSVSNFLQSGAVLFMF